MRNWLSTIALIGLGPLLILCSSCGTEYQERRGISLGGVVSEASKEPDEQRVVVPDTARVRVEPVVIDDGTEFEGQKTVVPYGAVAVEKGGQPAAPPDTVLVPSGAEQPPQDEGSEASSDDDKSGWYVGVLGGGGGLTGNNVKGFLIGGLAGGGTFDSGKTRFEFQGLIGSAKMKDGSELARGLKNEFTLGVGLAIYYHLTSPHTFMGLYAHGGIRYSNLIWDYENPVEVATDAGTDTVEGDSIGYTEMYAGLGVSLAQGKYGRLGVSASGGFRTYNDSTSQGFDNDLFHDEGLFQIMLDVMFGKFWR